MSSTSMHMRLGVSIMKSTDLINWKLINYTYDILDDVDALNLNYGESSYGRRSLTSCLRCQNGIYNASTFAGTSNKTYIYSTINIEKGR
ncbi:MAG: hypothetical protein PF541_13340 [Prolixibacteraceae bacterium]|nr:hypothetical protein [Prolixibacteraceae bacterium]